MAHVVAGAGRMHLRSAHDEGRLTPHRPLSFLAAAVLRLDLAVDRKLLKDRVSFLAFLGRRVGRFRADGTVEFDEQLVQLVNLV